MTVYQKPKDVLLLMSLVLAVVGAILAGLWLIATRCPGLWVTINSLLQSYGVR